MKTTKYKILGTSWFPLVLFAAFYLVLFWQLQNGVGNNWDWLFPYFPKSGEVSIGLQLTAWQASEFGHPLGYASRSIYSLAEGLLQTTTIRPEIVAYLLLAGLFTAGSSIVYRYWSKITPGYWAVLIAVVAMVNPAVFYKLLAGHLIYIVGYILFLLLIHYLLSLRGEITLRRSITIALLVALTGVQIQFFVFSWLAVFLYFCFVSNKYAWKYAPIIIGLLVLVHSYWLLQFAIGAQGLANISESARADTFVALGQTKLREIVSLTFSSATFIRNFFNGPLLWFFALFWLIPLAGWIRARKLTPEQRWLVACLAVFTLLVSGIYQGVEIPGINRFYPLLRESGHSAPLVILFLALLAGAFTWGRRSRLLITGYLALFILISLPVFYQNVPRVPYQLARQEFSDFSKHLSTIGNSDRVLSYPFFNQYGFLSLDTNVVNNTPMDNSGWDSFSTFSGVDFVSNAVSPQKFKDSLQYRFIKSGYDVALLEPYGIRYIYDYSDIYQSNYNHFVTADIYDNDLSVIKNDPGFSAKLIAANPQRIRQVSPKIFELVGSQPIVGGEGVKFRKVNETRYEVKIEDPTTVGSLRFLSNYHSGWRLYQSSSTNFSCDTGQPDKCDAQKQVFTGDELSFLGRRSLFNDSHQMIEPLGNEWKISSQQPGPLYLTMYYYPQSAFVAGLIVSLLALLVSLGFCVFPSKRSPELSRQYAATPPKEVATD